MPPMKNGVLKSSMLSLLAVASLLGCADNPELFVDIRWQVKCGGRNGCIQSDHPAHDIFTRSGGQSNLDDPSLTVAASCDLVELSNGDFSWSFRASTSEYSIQIRNAIIPAGGGAISGTSCSVRFEDDVNIFEADCGSEPISDTQQCRLTAVGFADATTVPDFMNQLSGPTLSTTLICEDVPSPINATIRRDVTAPDGTSPVPINIVNCDGSGRALR